MIANYRVPSDLSSLESTTDGYSVVLGMFVLFVLVEGRVKKYKLGTPFFRYDGWKHDCSNYC